MMSGALMWEDEQILLPIDEFGWYRAALNYRTSIILGKPCTEFAPIWNALKEVAPNWIGFREERCAPNPEFVAEIQKERE